jgi:ribosome biogenesis GTPase / thiamine phosphate phosphatase
MVDSEGSQRRDWHHHLPVQHLRHFAGPDGRVFVFDKRLLNTFEQLPRTVALLGPSGAGKPTLINQLADAEVTETGEVRRKDRRGRHTTTGRELFPIPGGALLLDTPGLRELRVLDLEEGLDRSFPEIEELSRVCRFRDCSHSSEPGCAVLAAVERGRLGAERLASFRKLQAEAAYERRRIDPQARAEHVAEHKTTMRTVKYHPKYQREE